MATAKDAFLPTNRRAVESVGVLFAFAHSSSAACLSPPFTFPALSVMPSCRRLPVPIQSSWGMTYGSARRAIEYNIAMFLIYSRLGSRFSFNPRKFLFNQLCQLSSISTARSVGHDVLGINFLNVLVYVID